MSCSNTRLDGVEPGEFGYDAATRAGNVDAIRLARDTGRFQVSQPMNIAQSPAGMSRLVLRAPVYRYGAPLDRLEQRRAALEGFVVLTIDSQAAFGTKFANFALAGESLAIDDLGLAQAAPPRRRRCACLPIRPLPTVPPAPRARPPGSNSADAIGNCAFPSTTPGGGTSPVAIFPR